MEKLEPRIKYKHKPSVSFQIAGAGRVNIILHEEIMDETGLKVGDTVDVKVGKNRLAITTGDTFPIREYNYKSSNHGRIVVSLEKLPKKSFDYYVKDGYVSIPLEYR